jgi:hypothetical protein
MRTLFLAALTAASLGAQQPGTGAILVLYQPKPGMNRDFELGDQRHLAWHHSVNDPDVWPGWTIMTGERQGFFMDATFFHAWTDFDHPLEPDEDEANWEINVQPYADVRNFMMYDALPALTTLTTGGLSAAYMTLCHVELHPGAGAKFEAALAVPLRSATMPHMVLRPVSGVSDYLVMLSAAKQSDLPADAAAIATMLESTGALVDRVTTETLQYRPELSYVPR